MIALRAAVILQGLLLAARWHVRGINPELEEKSEEELKHRSKLHHGGWEHGDSRTSNDTDQSLSDFDDVSGSTHYSEEPGHAQPTTSVPEDMERLPAETHTPGIPARTGNWCAYVHKRVVSVAVACGTEKYVTKSQKPCRNGEPDCYLVLYSLSTRPVYRQKQKIYTELQWRCCPGHGGHNCGETVEDSHMSNPEDFNADVHVQPEGSDFQVTDSEQLSQTQEQNDNEKSRSLVHKTSSSEETQTPPSRGPTGHDRSGPHKVDEAHAAPPPQPQYTNNGVVPIHYLKDVLMSHLQPVLDSFNLTLARLSEEVKDLQKDMTQLQVRQMLEGETSGTDGGMNKELEQNEDRLSDTIGQLEELKTQLLKQHDNVEEKLHEQQIIMQYNLTTMKMDIDAKIKHNQKKLQIGLQSLNSTLSSVQERQEQLEEDLQTTEVPATSKPLYEQPQNNTAIWEAINLLDNKVVNNTISLNALNKEQLQITKSIKDLGKGHTTLMELIVETGKKSEEKYIEAFLEVDEAKEAVKNYASNLVSNISALQVTLQEIDVDMDYLYKEFYKNISSASEGCDCKDLNTSMEQLKQVVSKVVIVAYENKMALSAEERLGTWDNREWSSAVENLKTNLQNVQNSQAMDQEKLGILQQNMTTLQTFILGNQLDIEALQQQDRATAYKIRILSSSFDSLIADAVRHAKVLDALLDEEVAEFLDWSPQEQATYSIPALRKIIKDMQEKTDKHSQNSDEQSDEEDWSTVRLKRRIRERHTVDQKSSGDELINLQKAVQQLKEQVIHIGKQQCLSCCNCTGAAAEEVDQQPQVKLITVYNSLEDHLRVFNSLFSNTEGLSNSEAPLDLVKLSEFINRKKDKRQGRREKKRADARAAKLSKRDASLDSAAHSQVPDRMLMFVASSTKGMNKPGTVVFETASINLDQMYSQETGRFRAPTEGVYLFVLTLDCGPGPFLAHLRRGEDIVASLYQRQRSSSGPATRISILQLQQGEEVHLQLVEGTVAQKRPQDNTFAGLLLLQTT